MPKTLQILYLCFMILISCKDKVSQFSGEVSNSSLERVEPSNWWVGYKETSLQLLVKEENIGKAKVIVSYSGVSVKGTHQADSPNYLFIDLDIASNAKAGKFDILFEFEDGDEKYHTYELKERSRNADEFIGFNSSDVVYLITPDRFANGDSSNDSVDGLRQAGIDRANDYARHGGDIKGITDNLDYIEKMGFTSIWSSPLLINDMAEQSYHGYAITNFYQVDPRFGSLEDYVKLADKAREKGIGLIMDQVANHCGLEHWWMKDLPFKDWVNNQDAFLNNEFVGTSHRRTVNQDKYASKKDRDAMSQGWFVPSMPDLNQRNPFMARYITQNSVWWIETLGLSGIRQDTYPYPDKQFMSDWAKAIMTEYPQFSIVGEEWSYNPLLIAYWQEGANNKDGYASNLRSTMDFAMQSNIVQALNDEESWNQGLVKIYEGLANDFAYASPKDIMVFPDNHDMSRIFTQLKGDVENTKMALGLMLTLPRIPQIYYGTEILMEDFKKPGDHGLIRSDFPGGWQGDAVNAFSGEGLNDQQKGMQDFLRELLNYRKTSLAIHDGETVHFIPENGVYVLFRKKGNETVVTILNKNENAMTLDLEKYEEIGLKNISMKDIISGKPVLWNKKLSLNEKGILILTTKK